MIRNALLTAAVAAWSIAAGGCYLYFEDNSNSGYGYCDATGCYWCDDYGCYPSSDGEVGPGSTCTANDDCNAGCFCSDQGLCEEAGFCADDDECAAGFECDDRNSCVPEGSDDACTADAECPEGSVCDLATGECAATGSCVGTATCPDGMSCDEDRNTCVPESPITCQGQVTCGDAAPVCPAGSTAAIQDGCYTGQCLAKSDCVDGAPFECADLDADESACVANATCSPVYRGIDCADPAGNQCTSDQANCTCASFQYDYCEAK